MESIYSQYSNPKFLQELDYLIYDMSLLYSTEYNEQNLPTIFQNYIHAFKILYYNADVFDEETSSKNVDSSIIGQILLSIATIYSLTNYFIVNNVFDTYKEDEIYNTAKDLFTKYKSKFQQDLQSDFNIHNLKDQLFLRKITYHIVDIYITSYLKQLQTAEPNFVKQQSRISKLLSRFRLSRQGGNSKSKKIRKLKKYQKL